MFHSVDLRGLASGARLAARVSARCWPGRFSAFFAALLILSPRAAFQGEFDLIFKDSFENHAPVITSTPPTTGATGVPYSYDIDATDVDGDSLQYLLTTSPVGMNINPGTGLIAWTPASPGNVPVAVEVSDGQGGSDTQGWVILVSDPGAVDGDEDGLSDNDEALHGTDPEVPDTDGDGLTDGTEIHVHGSDPRETDSDGDGLADGAEVNTHDTDPTLLDTDGDSFGDGLELDSGTDPLDADDFPGGLPDPSALAPDNDPTAATTLFDSVEFLFNGNPPIQTGVTPGAIDPVRAAVIRGLVLTREGDALPGVTVSIHDHPELGQTSSRVDGRFDLVVNGGGLVTVNYAATGYLPGQRTFEVPHQDWVQAPDMALIPLDLAVSAIDLTDPGMKVAQGSEVTDADGTRQATVLVPEGVAATLVMPDGTTQPLTNLAVRATEYTVGDMGDEAMPGELPPASAYTYAVELSVDAALAAGGQVEFSAPLPFYVENFLDFPVGTAVPAGYYDRLSARWIAAPNGLVIKIVGETGGQAEVDVTGDDVADTGTAVSDLGITTAELQHLATLYQPGQSLWRVPIEHFTPWDCNWPYSLPDNAIRPLPSVSSDGAENFTCGEVSGSIIQCQTQRLRESVAVTGTPFTLNYSSQRTPGRLAATQALLSASGPTVPASLKRIEVDYTIAGSSHSAEFSGAPNQTLPIAFNGRDAFGRPVQGEVDLRGEVRYVYDGVYRDPAEFAASFGNFGLASLIGDRTRAEVSVRGPFRTSISTWDARAISLGGWTLNVHHAYDFAGRKLHLGSGRSVKAIAMGAVMDRLIAADNDVFDHVGGDVAAAADGSALALDGPQNIVYRRLPNGDIERAIGCDPFQHDPCVQVADGVPALQARFQDGPPDFVSLSIAKLATGPGSATYLAGYCWIGMVDNTGVFRLIGGSLTNDCSGGTGDGGPATAASIGPVNALDAGPDGSVYLIDGSANAVRRIGPDGIITTFAGTGNFGYAGDGGLATNAQFRVPRALAVGPDGTVYIADSWNFRLRAVTADGIIRTVAGTGTAGFGGAGGLAIAAQLAEVVAIDAGPDGRVVLAEYGGGGENSGPYSCRLMVLEPNGRLHHIAGVIGCVEPDGDPLFAPTGLLARQYAWDEAHSVKFAPNGDILFLWQPELWRITAALPQFQDAAFAAASENGTEYYLFDADGRHQQTLHTLTGATLLEFGYDPGGRLISITDGDGNVTTIERTPAGLPIAIVGPFGHETTLETGPYGFLENISSPTGETLHIQSSPDGLILKTTDPRGRVSSYGYDELGRLVSQSDNAGFAQTLARTDVPGGFIVDRTSVMGRVTSYDVELNPGNVSHQVITSPDGSLYGQTILGEAGLSSVTAATGMTLSQEIAGDPRFGMQAPFVSELEVTAPAGPQVLVEASSDAVLSNPADLFSLVSLTESATVAGRTTSSEFTAATDSLVLTSPEGRTQTFELDDLGRTIHRQFADTAPVAFSFNALGQLQSQIAGTGGLARETTMTYGTDGFYDTITDALGHTATFERDAGGRVTRAILPDTSFVDFSYNAAGDLDGITPPGQPEHAFTYTKHGQLASLIPPIVDGTGPTIFAYNFDRQLTSINLPGNEEVTISYDATGRRESIELAEGGLTTATYSMTYVVADQLDTITGPGAQTVSYEYQGDLLTGVTWDGVVEGGLTRTLDNAFRVVNISLVGGNSIGYGRDDDDLLTSAGALAISRNATNGLPQSATLGVVGDTWTHNVFGEVVSNTVAANAITQYSVNYTRDDLGRMSQKVETVGGVSDTYDYDHDSRGRLVEVQKNGVVIESYSYDDNGNRTSATVFGSPVSATYDAQDRVLTHGVSSYTHGPAGRLLTRTDPGALVTTYDYDPLGNLRGVTLPDGTEITYGLDGHNHRVQRAVDGVITQRWLYDGIQPIAELDELGNVVSQFVYAGGNAPAYMIRAGTNYRFVADQVGSIRLVVNATTGAIAQRIDYDSFGNVITDTNPGFQPFGFAGGLYDPDTRLTRFGARDYDSELGRWTAKDPIGFIGGGTNLYAYVNSDPVNEVDPWGLGCFSFWEAVNSRFNETNKFIPGLLAPTGLGFATGGTIAQNLGTKTLLAAARQIATAAATSLSTVGAAEAAALASAGATTMINFLITGVAYEAGVLVGSFIGGLIDWQLDATWGDSDSECDEDEDDEEDYLDCPD